MAEREWFDKDYYKILGVSPTASDKLLSASQSFSQRLYEEAAQANATPSAESGEHSASTDDDEIVDAEIVDEK